MPQERQQRLSVGERILAVRSDPRAIGDILRGTEESAVEEWMLQRLQGENRLSGREQELQEMEQRVLKETGLPGRKVRTGITTVYLHGIIHGQGDTSYRLLQEMNQWVQKRHQPAQDHIVVCEENLLDGFGIEDHPLLAYESKDVTLIHRFYPKSKKEQEAYLRGEKNVPGTIWDRTLNGKKKGLLDLRRAYRCIPEPISSLIIEHHRPHVHAIERSYAMYAHAEAIRRYQHPKRLHLVIGLGHESHLAALYAIQPNIYNSKGEIALSVPSVQAATQSVIAHLAQHGA